MDEWAPEARVDEALARRLIREQFPELEQRAVRLLGEGWDTTVWLVDEAWVFRFPRRAMVVPGLENEIAYLPELAPLLPLPVPVPTLLGRPTDAFGWPSCSTGAPSRPRARAEFESAYGPLADDQLVRSRTLALFLCGTLAVYGDHEGPPQLRREALESLERIIRTG